MVGHRVFADRQLLADLAIAQPSWRPAPGSGPRAGRARRADRRRCADAMRADLGQQSGHPDPLGQAGRLAEQRLGPLAGPAAPAEQEAGVLVGGVGHPGRRAHLLVLRHRPLEVLLGPLGLSQRRGEHPQVAVGRPVAGDQMADHHVGAGEGLELRVDDRRHRLLAERAAGVGRDRRASRARGRRGSHRCPPGEPASSRLASRSMPSSASTATSPGRQGPSRSASPARILTAGASSASRPCSRRTPNIWIP